MLSGVSLRVHGEPPTAADLSDIGRPGAAAAVRSWPSCALGALLEGLVEGAEVGLGLSDDLAGERDQDAAEGLRLGQAGIPAHVVQSELVGAVEDARHDQPTDPAQ